MVKFYTFCNAFVVFVFRCNKCALKLNVRPGLSVHAIGISLEAN